MFIEFVDVDSFVKQSLPSSFHINVIYKQSILNHHFREKIPRGRTTISGRMECETQEESFKFESSLPSQGKANRVGDSAMVRISMSYRNSIIFISLELGHKDIMNNKTI